MQGVFILLYMVSNLYQLFAIVCSVLFYIRRKNSQIKPPYLPKVACLKPLCGYDAELQKNISSFLTQDYPRYEVVFGTAEADDVAYEIAKNATKGIQNVKVVSGHAGNGVNRKVSNLQNIYTHISKDIEVIVLSDSDTWVDNNYLKQMIAPFEDSQTGAVTAIYRIDGVADAGGFVEALLVEHTFVPSVLVAERIGGLKYAFGASIALKVADFDKIGGFDSVKDYLADDYMIGNLIYKYGKKVRLCPYVVSISASRQSLKQVFSRLIRWSKTIRVSEPVGYFFSAVCYSSVWGVCTYIVFLPKTYTFTLLAIAIVIRICSAICTSVAIGSRGGLLRAFTAPVWDLLALFIWFLGFTGNTVIWRGIRYRILKNGKMATEAK